jgi:hypothetical protein
VFLWFQCVDGTFVFRWRRFLIFLNVVFYFDFLKYHNRQCFIWVSLVKWVVLLPQISFFQSSKCVWYTARSISRSKSCGKWYLHWLITLSLKNNHFTSVNHYDQSHAASASSMTVTQYRWRKGCRHNICDIPEKGFQTGGEPVLPQDQIKKDVIFRWLSSF